MNTIGPLPPMIGEWYQRGEYNPLWEKISAMPSSKITHYLMSMDETMKIDESFMEQMLQPNVYRMLPKRFYQRKLSERWLKALKIAGLSDMAKQIAQPELNWAAAIQEDLELKTFLQPLALELMEAGNTPNEILSILGVPYHTGLKMIAIFWMGDYQEEPLMKYWTILLKNSYFQESKENKETKAVFEYLMRYVKMEYPWRLLSEKDYEIYKRNKIKAREKLMGAWMNYEATPERILEDIMNFGDPKYWETKLYR